MRCSFLPAWMVDIKTTHLQHLSQQKHQLSKLKPYLHLQLKAFHSAKFAMHSRTIISVVALLTTSAFATTVSYDNTYDNPSGDLHTVACSDGSHGLLPFGSSFSSLPNFPNIGGSSVVAGWNSVNCGTCWELTYSDTGRSINILVVDHTDDGFNISQEALDLLTDGQAVQLGRIDADVKQVDASQCGL